MRLIIRDFFKLVLFWIICFDLNRIIFSLYHARKVFAAGFSEWFWVFIYSFRVDLATAAALSIVPFAFRVLDLNTEKKWSRKLFTWTLGCFVILLICVQAGESVAYTEWNHKLTSRVFMHLSNPDEVARTADYGMYFYFTMHAIVRILLFFWIAKKMFKTEKINFKNPWIQGLKSLFLVLISWSLFFLAIRGGLQPVPLNTDSAAFSNKTALNDVSINSLYFFGKSYLLYKRTEIDEFIPKTNIFLAKKEVDKWYNYPVNHNQIILNNRRPNIVFIIFEGWSASAISSLSNTKNSTPHFDRLVSQGVLFDQIYATSTTSEIGNSSIFSGNPAIPEVSISMQPEKHRKISCINEDLEAFGYKTSYTFSGDLKYGNIGSYFKEHGFDVVKDELNFDQSLQRGRLNFFDKDLYTFLLNEIKSTKEPFLQCAFTGSTHFPYDQPLAKRGKPFKGEEADYMNALVYADECLGQFISKCKKESWYKNTLFVMISDHGHPSPNEIDPSKSEFFRIPMLFFGEPVKKEFRGKRIHDVGAQSDLAATLIYQLKGDTKRYPFSKDLLNPKSPKYAFHSIIRGYGWVTKEGNFTHNFDLKMDIDQTYKKNQLKKERKRCVQFLNTIYQAHKAL